MSEHTTPMDEQEIPLSGGNVTPVVRAGSTVRRALGPWSSTVHHLLEHVAASGFVHAPRFLGIDQQGREILSFLPGDVGFFPYIYTDAALHQAARLLRQFHDATATYCAPAQAQWQFSDPHPSHHEVICHNDFAPYNLVFAQELPTAIIDFDTAGPGLRLWDIAYAVYWFVPLYGNTVPTAPGLHDLARSSTRLHAFCAAYGCPCTPELLDMVERRLEALCAIISSRAEQGMIAYQRMLAEGHLAGYQRALRDLRQHRPALDTYLVGTY